jgi:hypothetical protein
MARRPRPILAGYDPAPDMIGGFNSGLIERTCCGPERSESPEGCGRAGGGGGRMPLTFYARLRPASGQRWAL